MRIAQAGAYKPGMRKAGSPATSAGGGTVQSSGSPYVYNPHRGSVGGTGKDVERDLMIGFYKWNGNGSGIYGLSFPRNVMYAVPHGFTTAGEIQRLTPFFSAVAAMKGRIGIYTNDLTGPLYPGALVYSSSEIDMTVVDASVRAKNISLSYSVTSGALLWFVFWFGGGAADPQLGGTLPIDTGVIMLGLTPQVTDTLWSSTLYKIGPWSHAATYTPGSSTFPATFPNTAPVALGTSDPMPFICSRFIAS